MSDDIKGDITEAGKKLSRNPVSKKADQIFATVLNLRSAGKSAKKKDGQASRTFGLDVSAAAEAALGSVRGDLARTCKPLNLTSPLLDQFTASFEISVTTGTAIWEQIDNNKFWEQAQVEALATCRDKVAAGHLERIRKEGSDLNVQLVFYANLLHTLQTTLPDDVQESLQSDLDTFVSRTDTLMTRMKRDIEIKSGQYLTDFIKKQLKLEKDIFKYRASKSAIVFIDTGLIAGHIAHMASSFGATAPLAIIACVRLVIEIGQIAEKALRGLEGIGKKIQDNIDIVKKFWGAKAGEVGTAEKLRATGAEVVAGIVAGVTNWEVPSVQTIKTLMNDYHHKLNILTKSYNDLGAELSRLQRIMEAYTAILNKHSQKMTAEQKKKVNGLIDGAIETYSAMYEKALGSGGKAERMAKADQNIIKWNVSIGELDNVTSKYTKWVSKVTKVATSAGLGLGNLGGELAGLVHELAEKSAEAALLVHEHAAEALVSAADEEVIKVSLEIASVKLKMMGEAVVVLVADAGLVNLCEELGEVKD